MSLDIDEPVCVIDIDMSFINDYMDVINYPIKRGEFVAAQSWWKDTDRGYKLQGGFQKYYPKDVKYIYDEFVSRPEYWMEYYPKKQITIEGMGEQFFVEDMARQRLKIKHLPDTWVTRWEHQMTERLQLSLNLGYPADWLHLGEEFADQLKLVHYLDQEALCKEDLEALASSSLFSS